MIRLKHVTLSEFKPPGLENLSSRSFAMHVRATYADFKSDVKAKSSKKVQTGAIICSKDKHVNTWHNIDAIFSEQSGEEEALRDVSRILSRTR